MWRARRTQQTRCENPQPDCRCVGCRTSRAWQEGKFAHRRHRPRFDRWTPAMDQCVRDHAHCCSPSEIATILLEHFGVPRTVRAVVVRMLKLGLSTIPTELTAQQVAAIFRVRSDWVTDWLRAGFLYGVKDTPTRSGQWKIKSGDVEKFISEHVEQYDWRNMPSSRYRALAEIAWRSDPVYPLQDAARILRIGMDVLYHALAHGQLRGTATNRARGVMRRWVVRRSALLEWRDQVRSAALSDAQDVAV